MCGGPPADVAADLSERVLCCHDGGVLNDPADEKKQDRQYQGELDERLATPRRRPVRPSRLALW
jgi:hypothetical protein